MSFAWIGLSSVKKRPFRHNCSLVAVGLSITFPLRFRLIQSHFRKRRPWISGKLQLLQFATLKTMPRCFCTSRKWRLLTFKELPLTLPEPDLTFLLRSKFGDEQRLMHFWKPQKNYTPNHIESEKNENSQNNSICGRIIPPKVLFFHSSLSNDQRPSCLFSAEFRTLDDKLKRAKRTRKTKSALFRGIEQLKFQVESLIKALQKVGGGKR